MAMRYAMLCALLYFTPPLALMRGGVLPARFHITPRLRLRCHAPLTLICRCRYATDATLRRCRLFSLRYAAACCCKERACRRDIKMAELLFFFVI